jgi:hypothetical protein
MNKEVDMEADDIKVALFDDSHSFTATDANWAAISANEITGTGYTTKGASLASGAVTKAATTKYDADNLTWSTGTFSAWHGVIYNEDHASDNLIASIDFGGEQAVTAADFTIAWHADGIITIA